MSRTLTIRNVPDEVAHEMQRRARNARQSLQAFLLSLLEETASCRPIEEVIAEVEARLAAQPRASIGSEEIVRTFREFRDDARR